MFDTRTIRGSSQMAVYRQLQHSQANKGIRRMPRRQEPKKDAVSCEKPGGTASKYRSLDIRMGQPGGGHAPSSIPESMRRAPGELKHLSTRRKSNQQEIPLVAASEQGRAQTRAVYSGQSAANGNYRNLYTENC